MRHGVVVDTENGEIAILWIGQAVSPQILQDLYAVENLDQLDTRMVSGRARVPPDVRLSSR